MNNERTAKIKAAWDRVKDKAVYYILRGEQYAAILEPIEIRITPEPTAVNETLEVVYFSGYKINNILQIECEKEGLCVDKIRLRK